MLFVTGHCQVAPNGLLCVLVLQRIVCRRSIRTWAYEMFGNERAVHFTAMATPDDLGGMLPTMAARI
jgi:hypothetical protein